MSERFVFDASALLCMIYGETGSAEIEGYLNNASIGAVNYSEVVAKLQERGASDAEISLGLARLKIVVLPFDADLAIQAGKLRAATRKHGLSLGDRACLALAIAEKAVAVTTDKAWASLDIGVKLQVVR